MLYFFPSDKDTGTWIYAARRRPRLIRTIGSGAFDFETLLHAAADSVFMMVKVT